MFLSTITKPEQLLGDTIQLDDSNSTKLQIKVQRQNVPGSTKKNNRLAQLIRGMHAEDALAQLYFVKKRRRDAFMLVIQRGINRASLQHDIPQNRLRIAEVFVNKGQVLKRPRFHGKGKMGKQYHRFSHIKMVLEETEELPVLGQRGEDVQRQSNWAMKFKNGILPKDLQGIAHELIFPYRHKVPNFTNKAV